MRYGGSAATRAEAPPARRLSLKLFVALLAAAGLLAATGHNGLSGRRTSSALALVRRTGSKARFCSWNVFGVVSKDGQTCCKASCGACGGSGCSQRPGGTECCAGKAQKRGSCERSAAPCRMNAPHAAAPAKTDAKGLEGVRAFVMYMPPRKAFAQEHIAKLGLTPATTFVQGVDFKTVELDQMIESGIVSNYSGHHFGCSTCAVTSGRVACQLGHRRMLNLFMDSGAPIGLFFEDDAVVNPALNGLSSGTALRRELHDRFAALKKADKDWDMLFLGRCYDDCRDPQKVAEHLDKAKRPLCMHAYALSRRGAQRVLDSMLPQTDNGDVMVANMIIADKLRAYVRSPALFSTETKAFESLLGRKYKPTNENGQPECQTEPRLEAWEDGKFKTMEGVYAFHVAERKAGTDGVAKAKGQPQDKH